MQTLLMGTQSLTAVKLTALRTSTWGAGIVAVGLHLCLLWVCLRGGGAQGEKDPGHQSRRGRGLICVLWTRGLSLGKVRAAPAHTAGRYCSSDCSPAL